MAKYKVGDKVRIVSERPDDPNFTDGMLRFLGKEITISTVRELAGTTVYYSKDAQYTETLHKFLADCYGIPDYYFKDEWIAGLAEPKKSEFSVSIHFHDRLTVAELIKDGKVVKVENARCNPKDKYSMAEGARIAVERLFQKKAIHIGEKLIVTGNLHTPIHYFRKGTIVTVINFSHTGSIVCKADNGQEQYVSRFDLKQYKEKGE